MRKHSKTDGLREQLIRQIVDRARAYNWPAQADYIEKNGVCPPGFGHEVGKDVALFMATPPLGGMLQTREAYARSREDDLEHGRMLAELRLWVARLNYLNNSKGNQ